MPLITAIVVALLIAAAYMAPSLIAYARAVPGTGDIARINLRVGWTGTGWARALRMALVRPPAAGAAPVPGPVSWRARVRPGHLDAPWRPGAPTARIQASARPGDPAEGGPKPVTAARAARPGPGTGAAPAPGEASGAPSPAQQSNGAAVAGMVLGILAVVFEWFGLITLALAMAAVVLGAVGNNRSAAVGTGHRQGVAGVVLGIIGLAAYIFWGAISKGILWLI